MSSHVTLESINYQLSQIISDITAHKQALTDLKEDVHKLHETLYIRRTYLKQLLIYRAEKKQTSIINDYIALLCTIYKTIPEIPYMETDTTPGWLIADAVISETNDKDRLAFTDIFRYLYDYNPQIYFPS
jgi:hypothetical protein